jgi:hypothetical protein
MRAPEVQKGGIPEKYALATGGVRRASGAIGRQLAGDPNPASRAAYL